MSKVVVLHNCTVEMTMPDVDIDSMDIGRGSVAKIALFAREYVQDVLVHHGHKIIKIKRLFLDQIRAKMLPVTDGEQAVWFTVEDEVKPDVEVTR